MSEFNYYLNYIMYVIMTECEGWIEMFSDFWQTVPYFIKFGFVVVMGAGLLGFAIKTVLGLI